MKITDAMVEAGHAEAVERGWEMDEGTMGDLLHEDVRLILEAGLAAAPPRAAPSGKRARALLARAKWADEARRNAKGGNR